jgi:carboxymethylenebutenolidase
LNACIDIDRSLIEAAAHGGRIDVRRFAPRVGADLPAVLVLMDAPGLRPALDELAARIAAHGFLVWMPNLYWRIGRDASVGPTRDHPDAERNRETMMGYIASLDNETVVGDVEGLVRAMSEDVAWNRGPIGLTGYCMSGRFATLAACRLGDRAACAASYFGTRLVVDGPASPHGVLPGCSAELYFAFAEHDHYAPPAVIESLRAALRDSPVKHRIEVYPGTEHGFVFPDRGTFYADGASRHWASLLELLDRTLRQRA